MLKRAIIPMADHPGKTNFGLILSIPAAATTCSIEVETPIINPLNRFQPQLSQSIRYLTAIPCTYTRFFRHSSHFELLQTQRLPERGVLDLDMRLVNPLTGPQRIAL